MRRKTSSRQPESAAFMRLHLAGPAGVPDDQAPVPRGHAGCLHDLAGRSLAVWPEAGTGPGFEVRDMFINGFGVLAGIAIGILSRRQPARSSVAFDSELAGQ